MTSLKSYVLVPGDIAARLRQEPELLLSIAYTIDDSPPPESVRRFELDRLEGELLVVMESLGWQEICHLLQTGLTRIKDPDGNQMILKMSASHLRRLRGALSATSLDGALDSLRTRKLYDPDEGKEMEERWVEALVEMLGELRAWVLERPQKDDVLLMFSDA